MPSEILMVSPIVRLGMTLAMATWAAGCGDDTAPAGPRGGTSGQLSAERSASPLRWVGAVEQTDVSVAVLAGAGKARVYFCGGAQSSAASTRWFDFPYDGGEHIEVEQDSWRIHVHLTLRGLVGEVELGDQVTRSVQASKVDPSTLAGLYEGTADCGRVGLIVTQATKSAPPTATGACTSTNGKPPRQVQPVAPITSEAGEIRVQVSGEGNTLLLRPAGLEPL